MLAIISKRLCLLKTTRLVSKDPRIDFLPQLPRPCLHFPFQIYPWRGGGKGKECIQKSASSPNPGKHYTKPLNNLRKEQDSQFPKTVLTFLFISPPAHFPFVAAHSPSPAQPAPLLQATRALPPDFLF